MANKMSRQLLFIHGAMDNDEDPDGIAPLLKRELAGEFTVSRPQFPEPDATIWSEMIETHLAGLPEDSVLVGHSFGGSMLLKVLAERMTGFRFAGLVLLAPPWWGPEGWDVKDFALPADFAAALTGLETVVHLHGRADEIVDFGHQAIYVRALPEARCVALEGVTHDFSGAGHKAVLDEIELL